MSGRPQAATPEPVINTCRIGVCCDLVKQIHHRYTTGYTSTNAQHSWLNSPLRESSIRKRRRQYIKAAVSMQSHKRQREHMFSPQLPVGDPGCRHIDVGGRRGATLSHGPVNVTIRLNLTRTGVRFAARINATRRPGLFDGCNSSHVAAHGASSVVHAWPRTVSSAAPAAVGEVGRAVGERG